MAAYAALVSLITTMDHIQNNPRLSISLDKKLTESLCEKVGFLLDFLESDPHGHNKETEVLESQIASAAQAAEDIIESHVVDQILPAHLKIRRLIDLQKVIKNIKRKVIKPIHLTGLLCGLMNDTEEMNSSSWLDLQTVMKGINAVKEKVVNAEEERRFRDLQPPQPSPATTSSATPLTSTGKSKIVGFDDELIQLMEWLTGHQSSRQIIPIVGMGGIGKTTIARNVYENSLIVQHFDIRAWATVSQEYSERSIFSNLLSCHGKSIGELDGEPEHQLAQELYQSLIRRRYLIILDDMWSIQSWDKIKVFFPDNKNGSRIVVTTRLSNVANYFGSSYLTMKFLDEVESWNLFCEKAFPPTGCPPKLEKVGKKIAKKCKGLPLLIVVIGAFLRKSSMTPEYWENISKDINSVMSLGEDEQSLDILSLSYNHLPAHLKPCYLYMGIFPEGDRINVSRLMRLWVAEGFIKPNKTQSLEEVAEGYFEDLVDRNLVLVGKLRWNGRIKTCGMHDLLRDLCLKAAQREKFICVIRLCDIPQIIKKERRIVFQEEITKEDEHRIFHALKSAPLTRSLINTNTKAIIRDRLLFKFKLMRVLDNVDCSLDDILKQVNLRYVCCTTTINYICELPSSISLLWNLQVLILRNEEFVASYEIWEMQQLRHVSARIIRLPEPHLSDEQDDFVLPNMHTLETVVNFTFSDEVCKRIPNIKRLKLKYEDLSESSRDDYCLHNLVSLHKLESLSYRFYTLRGDLQPNLSFPRSVRKLTLMCNQIHWEQLKMIGPLPQLEVLKLYYIRGPEWNPVEGEFCRLKFLKMYWCIDLRNWSANSSDFPVLEKLALYKLEHLDEIPLDIGEIPTLQLIELGSCSKSAEISAVKIVEEQESLGNNDLHVRISPWDKTELEMFRDKLKEESESFTAKNLYLD